MSIVTCEHCDQLFDRDHDPGCFIDNPYDSRDTAIMCERCREIAWDRQQERLMEDGPASSLLDQQQAAMKLKR